MLASHCCSRKSKFTPQAQQVLNLKTTSYQRRYEVVLTSCTCWEVFYSMVLFSKGNVNAMTRQLSVFIFLDYHYMHCLAREAIFIKRASSCGFRTYSICEKLGLRRMCCFNKAFTVPTHKDEILIKAQATI